MKNLFLFALLANGLFACQETPKATTEAASENKDAAPAVATDQSAMENLLAFYTGELPCKECKGGVKKVILTLNAPNTYTFEESSEGKPQEMKSQGTWSFEGDVVTLKAEDGSTSQYKIAADGLVNNADGSKLTKVLGE